MVKTGKIKGYSVIKHRFLDFYSNYIFFKVIITKVIKHIIQDHIFLYIIINVCDEKSRNNFIGVK